MLERGADNIHYKNNLLVKACRDGSVAKLELLLDFGARLDRGFDSWNETLRRESDTFLVPCQNNQFEIVKLLVARDANSNHSDLYDATALEYACAIGHYEIVKYLLENGVGVHTTCDYLDLPLEFACKNGSVEVVRMLLEYGAKVNRCDSCALTAASKRGHIEVAQLLLA